MCSRRSRSGSCRVWSTVIGSNHHKGAASLAGLHTTCAMWARLTTSRTSRSCWPWIPKYGISFVMCAFLISQILQNLDILFMQLRGLKPQNFAWELGLSHSAHPNYDKKSGSQLLQKKPFDPLCRAIFWYITRLTASSSSLVIAMLILERIVSTSSSIEFMEAREEGRRYLLHSYNQEGKKLTGKPACWYVRIIFPFLPKKSKITLSNTSLHK